MLWAVEMAWTQRQVPSLSWATAGIERESVQGGELEQLSVSIISQEQVDFKNAILSSSSSKVFIISEFLQKLLQNSTTTSTNILEWRDNRRVWKKNACTLTWWKTKNGSEATSSQYVSDCGIHCLTQQLSFCFLSAAQVYGQRWLSLWWLFSLIQWLQPVRKHFMKHQRKVLQTVLRYKCKQGSKINSTQVALTKCQKEICHSGGEILARLQNYSESCFCCHQLCSCLHKSTIWEWPQRLFKTGSFLLLSLSFSFFGL